MLQGGRQPVPDGALPNIATDEALRADPHHRLARLMRILLDLGVHGPTFDLSDPGEFTGH